MTNDKHAGEPALVPYDDVCRLANISKSALHDRIRRGKYRAQTLPGQTGPGRPKKGIWLEDLGPDIQERWRAEQSSDDSHENDCQDGDPDAGKGGLLRTAPVPVKAGDGGQQMVRGVPVTPEGLPNKQALEAMGCGSFWDEWDRKMRAVSLAEEYVDAAEYGGIGVAWRRAASEASCILGREVAVRTLQKWVKDADKDPALLCPKPRADRGQSRKIPPELGRKILDGWLDRSRPTVQQIYRDVVRVWCERNQKPMPHRSTVWRYINENTRQVENVAFREGRQAWWARCAPKVPRAYPDPGQVFVADHRKADTFVLHQGKAIRPWHTVIVDWGSGAWLSWRISLQPSAATVCHALRNAILQLGVPEAFYTDNGKEFTANRLGGKARRLRDPGADDLKGVRRWPAYLPQGLARRGIWSVLGVREVRALPYSSWSKVIEPFFGAWSTRYENWNLPGWCGRDAEERPELLPDDIREGNLLTFQQYGEVVARINHHWNVERAIGEREAPPAELVSGLKAKIPDRETLSFLLQDTRRVKVRQSGVTLRAGGEKFTFYRPELASFVGEKVEIAWDPQKAEGVSLYRKDGSVVWVPRAEKADPLEWGEVNKAAKKGERRQRQRLQRIQTEIKGSLTVEERDRFGAFRMVRARQELESEIQREPLEIPAADRAAQQAAAAREDAESGNCGEGEQESSGPGIERLLEGEGAPRKEKRNEESHSLNDLLAG